MTEFAEGRRLLVTMPGTVLDIDENGIHFEADNPADPWAAVSMLIGWDELGDNVIAQEIVEPEPEAFPYGPGDTVRSIDYPEFVFTLTTEGYVQHEGGIYYSLPADNSRELFPAKAYERVEVAA